MGTEELLKEVKNKKEKKSRKGLIIALSIFAIVISLIVIGVCCYRFLIEPYLTNLVQEASRDGIEYTIYTIMNEVGQCKEIPLTISGKTITLIAKECLG